MTFRRYVAIGDSSTEGLEDPDGVGGYRGWADRLAQLLADAQPEPLEYANLAVRGLRMHEIRETQLQPALDLAPDLLTVFGGVNDVIGRHCDFASIRTDHEAVFAAARALGCTVLTFTMPDPAAFNPLGWRLRERMYALNAIIRSEAAAHGVLVMDFQHHPVAEDPRLWFEDRLHGNPLGHAKVASALAWRLGVTGSDASWADPLPDTLVRPRPRQQLATDLDWAVHHLAPWLGRNLRGVPHGAGVRAKRPVPTVVPRTADVPAES
ncbi:Lysophospholipase L1 [Friedmanniella luteola]|uniref:Lysophospholipase L1 n=1 Tax=Friedmanniella luteola TaxID=546871 RepID=A0A1H1L1P9_9ACTN|nr:SGNH/GDSL hydrolase family protein [Friedmanniella luteola]SDR68456.1 Lysophospholipase L1 [Friedmanniella luteola]